MKHKHINDFSDFLNEANNYDKSKNFYKILGISEKATQKEIKKAYYILAMKYHPDKNPAGSEQFKEVNEAYEVLSDPKERKKYDSIRKRYNGSGRSSNQEYKNWRNKYQGEYGNQSNKSQSSYQSNYDTDIDKSVADYLKERKLKKYKKYASTIRSAIETFTFYRAGNVKVSTSTNFKAQKTTIKRVNATKAYFKNKEANKETDKGFFIAENEFIYSTSRNTYRITFVTNLNTLEMEYRKEAARAAGATLLDILINSLKSPFREYTTTSYKKVKISFDKVYIRSKDGRDLTSFNNVNYNNVFPKIDDELNILEAEQTINKSKADTDTDSYKIRLSKLLLNAGVDTKFFESSFAGFTNGDIEVLMKFPTMGKSVAPKVGYDGEYGQLSFSIITKQVNNKEIHSFTLLEDNKERVSFSNISFFELVREIKFYYMVNWINDIAKKAYLKSNKKKEMFSKPFDASVKTGVFTTNIQDKLYIMIKRLSDGYVEIKVRKPSFVKTIDRKFKMQLDDPKLRTKTEKTFKKLLIKI